MAAAGLAVSAAIAGTPASAAPSGSPGSTGSTDPASAGPTASKDNGLAKLSPGIASKPKAQHMVFVQLAGKGAADASAAAGKPSSSAARTAAKQRRTAIERSADAVLDQARSDDAKATALFTVTNAVPGIAVRATGDALTDLAARSDVVKITPLTTHTLANASTAQLTKALDTWKSAGNTGKGVTVGVIDTGIDYTHADFGGTGTVAAWDQAHATSAAPWTPTAKVVGGYDFVGDDYDADATASDYQPIPHPDVNPLGCNDHGTHVAGIVAGYGENADGSTFHGDYASLDGDDLYDMKVAPGMAPDASLYALKVFGCNGSTNEVIPALDWALDPNGDGDFSDHLDIVNMSLGADYAPADDPENAVIDNLAEHGVLSVIAMGNAGDVTDAGGSPGNAVRSVAVASSVDAYQLRDGLKVNAPSDVAGVAAGQFSIAYPWIGAPDVTGDVVASPADNADGCAPYSAEDAAAIAGKIVWQSWDDNDATRACGSAVRGDNAAQAGAIGAIFDSSLDVFAAGITGSADIPIIQLPKTESDRLRPALDAGTLNVTFDSSLAASVKSVTPGITDTLSSFSSRGTHGSVGVVKPDLTAPGDTVASAGLGSGDGVLVESGTSMATPNVAGIAALVTNAHPTWTTEQVKADLMNTAGHDLYAGDDESGPIFGPNRVGAGRVDALAAVDNDLLVYDKDVTGAVSASFGVVAAPITQRSLTRTRTLTVQNTGSAAKTVTLAYDAITSQPGVHYSVSPSRLTVGAGRTATAKVVLTVVPSKLRKTLDPTMNADSGIGVPRSYLSDASGRVLVTERGATPLRVPVYAAAKPTSATTAKAGTLTTGSGKHRTTSPALVLKGKGFSQGTGSEAYTSLASALELGATSPRLSTCTDTQTSGCLPVASDGVGDLKYVGTGSTPGSTGGYADGWLYIGISSWGQSATFGHSVIPYVQMDTTGDGVPDYEVDVAYYPDTDVPLAELFDLSTGENIDLEPINFNFGDVDTNEYDTDTLLIPIWPAKIGVTDDATSFPISYQVGTYDAFYYGTDIDDSPVVHYDVVDPALSVSQPLVTDDGGQAIPYELGSSATRSTKALVLHLHGAPGRRAEVVAVSASHHKPRPPHKRGWGKPYHSSGKHLYHPWTEKD